MSTVAASPAESKIQSHATAAPVALAEPAWLRYAAPAFLLGIGVALLAMIWGRVGDVLGGFGRAVHVAWRVAEGRVLYRDEAYLYGPLSPYVNAMWWLLLGGGDRAIVLGNLVVLAIVVVLMYRVLVAMADRSTAFVAVAFFLVCGAFGAMAPIGVPKDYNFLTPFAHGATHGTALGLGAIAALVALARSRNTWCAALAGVLVGLAALTKPDVAIAVFLASAIGIIAVLGSPASAGRRFGFAGAFIVGAVAPPLIALGLLSLAMPIDVAADGLLSGWRYVGDHHLNDVASFTAALGTDQSDRDDWKIVIYGCLYGRFLIALTLVALVLEKRYTDRSAAIGATLIVAAGLLALTQWYPYRSRFWDDAASGLAVFPVVGVLVAIGLVVRYRRDPSATPQVVAAIAFSVFAGALVYKIWLNARLSDYGFVYGVPAALVGIVLAVNWLPRLVSRAGGSETVARAGALALIGGILAYQLQFTAQALAEHTTALGSPASLLRYNDHHATVIKGLTMLRREFASPQQTLAVLPDAPGVQWVAGRHNPTRFSTADPLAATLYGERTIADAYAKDPPDFVLVIHDDARGFPGQYFGEQYATEVGRQLARDYDLIAEIVPDENGQLPVSVFRRRVGEVR